MKNRDKNGWIIGIMVFIITIILNLLLGFICIKIGLPPLLAIAGSMAIAILAGYMPAVWVVLISNLILSYFINDFLNYSLINILIIIVTAYYAQKGHFKKLSKILSYIILTSLISAVVSTLIVIETGGVDETVLESNIIVNDVTPSPLGMLAISSLIILVTAIPSQVICLLLSFLIVKILPDNIKDILKKFGWLQKPIDDDELERLEKTKTRIISTKTVFIIAIISTCLTVLLFVAAIGTRLFINHTKQEHEKIAVGVSEMIAGIVNGNRIDEYIASGGQGPEYEKIVAELEAIRDVSNDIEYVYVYKILPDGCHVVFDLDTDEVEAADVGEVVPFDPTFEKYVPTLLEGGEIETFVSDDYYGWLLTSYTPVHNSLGETVCYAGCDISMEYLSSYTRQFFIRLLIMCIGIIIVIIVTGLWIAKFRIIYPVKSMVERARFFNYDSEEARKTNVELLEDLEICTGDEIERLYNSFLQVTKDSMKSFSTMQQKSDYIEKVQTNLIVILADMVENRDESTGDHIKKTSMYTLIIMRQMKKEGMHTRILTDEFIDNVYKSAPLHDIGKIRITDSILNKPGKLTPEEFEIMKLHSAYGGEIINKLIESLTQASYLEVARDIALYHHERWDGTGYPEGLKGEDIPLSARIMAVADVFDALISERVYKKAFTFEKAVEIIQEESGTHFDPDVVKAFIDAIDEVRETAKLQKR
ncbi:HD domain-containing protein [Butyrivibrio fibrisolvens DSM 3071]|uniref:HD domain-containing protein n=1 Tax=Butyrivibrio fibrisolvens DSM 3071 TaxID=1121131 RepID=A0A1M5Z320_BUTFI|nr:HD domain-containing phosphohydrolase [Butyrivibrio fibrisolvens]SHI18645.1 HD domain-containing protein [Butyrivibrio fibrisolvens DSM 3071]